MCMHFLHQNECARQLSLWSLKWWSASPHRFHRLDKTCRAIIWALVCLVSLHLFGLWTVCFFLTRPQGEISILSSFCHVVRVNMLPSLPSSFLLSSGIRWHKLKTALGQIIWELRKYIILCSFVAGNRNEQCWILLGTWDPGKKIRTLLCSGKQLITKKHSSPYVLDRLMDALLFYGEEPDVKARYRASTFLFFLPPKWLTEMVVPTDQQEQNAP